MSGIAKKFFQACEVGCIQEVQDLFKNGFEVNTHEYPSGNTGLHICAREGFTSLASLLIQNGAYVNCLNVEHKTPLMLSMCDLSYLAKPDMVKLLIENGANVNGKDKKNCTPLFMSLQCRMEITAILLLNGATDDLYDWNALHYATKFLNTTEPILKLIEQGISVNARCHDQHPLATNTVNGSIPLHFILSENKQYCGWDDACFELIKAMISQNAEINAENELGENPLYLACVCDYSASIIDYLYQNGAKINESQPSPLIAACANNNTEVVKVHLQHNADINVKDSVGYTPLLWALSNRNQELTQILLNAKCDVEAKVSPTSEHMEASRFTQSVIPAVNIAVLQHEFEICEMLIKSGSRTTEVYSDNSNLLHFAVALNRIELVDILLQKTENKKSFVNQQNQHGHTPLHVACFKQESLYYFYRDIDRVKSSTTNVVDLLISAGSCVNKSDNQGYTPLITAIDAGNAKLAKLLLEKGANTEVYSKSGWYPIHMAIWTGNSDILKLLTKQRCSVNSRIKCKDPEFMFHNYNSLELACIIQNDSFTKVLLENGAELINCVTGANVLQSLVVYKRIANDKRSHIFETLLNHGVEINHRDINGNSVLHLAFQAKDYEFCNILLSTSGVDVNAVNNLGDSVLHSALSPKRLVSYTQKQLKFPNFIPWEINHKCHNRNKTSLIDDNRTVQSIQLLLKKGARLDILNVEGNLPLHIHLKHSTESKIILQSLLEGDSSIDVPNNAGQRPLDIAMKKYTSSSTEFLLMKGADYGYLEKDDQKVPLLVSLIASVNYPSSMIYNLLSHGCNINVTNKYYKHLKYYERFMCENALEYAAFANEQLIPALLLSGINIHNSHSTTLQLLVRNIALNGETNFSEKLQVVACLLSAGTHVNVTNTIQARKQFLQYQAIKLVMFSLHFFNVSENLTKDTIDILLDCGIKLDVDVLFSKFTRAETKHVLKKIQAHQEMPLRLDRQAANVIRTCLQPNSWVSVDKLGLPILLQEFLTFNKNEIIDKYCKSNVQFAAFKQLLDSGANSGMKYQDIDNYYKTCIEPQNNTPSYTSPSPPFRSSPSYSFMSSPFHNNSPCYTGVSPYYNSPGSQDSPTSPCYTSSYDSPTSPCYTSSYDSPTSPCHSSTRTYDSANSPCYSPKHYF